MQELADTVDLAYLRRLGEEIQARLFPRARKDGTRVYPMPIACPYEPQPGHIYPVVIVRADTIQQMGDQMRIPAEAFDTNGEWRSGWAYVTVVGSDQMAVDLTLGAEVPGTWEPNLVLLLRAITGTL